MSSTTTVIMNSSECIVHDLLVKRGFKVLRRGWPDFLCIKRSWDEALRTHSENPKAIMAVEVKAGRDKLSPDQNMVHTVLKAAGIPVYVIRPENAMETPRLRHKAFFLTSEELANFRHELDILKRKAAALEEIVSGATSLIEEIEHPHFSEMREIVNGSGPSANVCAKV